jgi:cyclopropane fatty-acyl-phospholipid synthase-like methyltransferase
MVRRYYDRNTRLFLTLGESTHAATIHRALWPPGVQNRAQALDVSHRLLAEQAATLPTNTPHILDLGCGVGGTLFSLAKKLAPGFHGTGVTISPVQVKLARAYTRRRRLDSVLTFIEADFLALPPLPPTHLAYSIEAFVLTSDPQGYFNAAVRVLVPHGRLVLIDDFLAPHPSEFALDQETLLAEFRDGWYAAGLDTVKAACARATKAGLRLIEHRDLTEWIRVDTFRDRLTALAAGLGRWLRMRSPYWNSLIGGDALRRCIASGLTEYAFLVFEKDD